jgi:hypothetical protein
MPLLNGRNHDWVSMRLSLPSLGRNPSTPQSVTYPAHKVESPDTYGTGAKPIGFTRGQYSVDGLEVEFLAGEWDEIRAQLGPGYMMAAPFPISISYADTDLVTRTDRFTNCRITSEQLNIAVGTDPLKSKVTFKPSEMILNGVPAVLAIKQ